MKHLILKRSCVLKKPGFDSLIIELLCHGPQKVQLFAKLQLIKYHNGQPDNSKDERIEIYANSIMIPVYANGLTIAAYWGMVEKTMSVLRHLFRWVVDRYWKK